MASRGVERRIARLEKILPETKAEIERRRLRRLQEEHRKAVDAAERVLKEVERIAAGGGKPVKEEHGVEVAIAYLLTCGEEKHREVLLSVMREVIERCERLNEESGWSVEGKWWDESWKFPEWVWRAVERTTAREMAVPESVVEDLFVLRNVGDGYWAPSELVTVVGAERSPVPEV